MKWMNPKRQVCVRLIAVFLLVGLCLKAGKTDLFVSYAEDGTVTSVLRQKMTDVLNQEFCADECMGELGSDSVLIQDKYCGGENSLDTALRMPSVANLLKGFTMQANRADSGPEDENSTGIFIVSYIHHQGGV